MELSVAVDAAHALLQPVGIPGDVVVEEDVAALEIDTFTRRFGGDEHLDVALPETAARRGGGVPASSREPGFMPPWMQPARKPQASSRPMR